MTALLEATRGDIARLRQALAVAQKELSEEKLLASATHAHSRGATPKQFVAELSGHLSTGFEVEHVPPPDLGVSMTTVVHAGAGPAGPVYALASRPSDDALCDVRRAVIAGGDFDALADAMPRYKNAMRELKQLFVEAGRVHDIPKSRLIRELALIDALRDYRPEHWHEVAKVGRVKVDDDRDLSLATHLAVSQASATTFAQALRPPALPVLSDSDRSFSRATSREEVRP